MSDLLTLPEVARVLDTDGRRLTRLMRLGVVMPVRQSRGRGDSPLYSIGSVVVLAVLQSLEAEGVSYAGRVLFAERFGRTLGLAVDSPDVAHALVIVSDEQGPRVVSRGELQRGKTYGVRVEFAPVVREVQRSARRVRSASAGHIWDSWHLRPAVDVAAALAPM